VTKRRFFFSAFVYGGLLCGSLSAGIIGTFNIGGSITVTQDTITWQLGQDPFTPNKTSIDAGPTGIYAGVAGDIASIFDLNRATSPVGGAGFAPQPFILFDTAPALAALDINYFFEGIYAAAGCLTGPAAVGQTCTPGPPITPDDSPFSFVNNPGGPSGVQSTATFAMNGVTTDGNVWTAIFTSQFNEPFQDVLADFFAQNGEISATYSATVTTSQIPEPAAMSTIGLILILTPFGMKRLRRLRASHR